MAAIQMIVDNMEIDQTNQNLLVLNRESYLNNMDHIADPADRGNVTDDDCHSEYTDDSDESWEYSDDDKSLTLQDMLVKELFGKKHCLNSPSRAAKRGYGTLKKLKNSSSPSPVQLPKVASSNFLIDESNFEEEAHASFERFLARKARSMENLMDDIPQSPARKAKFDPSSSPSKSSNKNPEEYLKSLLEERGIKYKSVPASTLVSQGFFVEMKHRNFADYNNEVAFAARKGDLAALRFHVASGRTAQCCNRYKESIIHTICRKGHQDLLKYILDTTDASVCICCDQFRTPLHDAAWTHNPNFEMIKMIIDACPDLLYVEDQRGHTPLAYVAGPHYEQWCTFLKENIVALSPTKI